MKSWRQLDALAKRQGCGLHHGTHRWQIGGVALEDNVASGEWWLGSAKECGRILRAMCEAALKEMRSKL